MGFKKALLGITLLVAVSAMAQEASEKRFVNYRQGFNTDTLALQVLLDRQHLSCNCADGFWGPRTEIALVTWQTLNGVPVTGVPDAALLLQLGGDTNVLIRYTVTSNDLAAVGPVPVAWEDRARMQSLTYETVQEMLAERGHTSQRALERLNPGVAWPNPPPGTEVVLPNCSYDKPEKAGSIRIALERREITAFNSEGLLIALFPCSIARNKSHRPAGEMSVMAIAPNPNYTYDPKLFNPGSEKKAKLVIPPGPNNPVGMAWIGLSLQGYGIHGTPIPEHIGRAESRGCFRLANWNAVKLLNMVEIGTPLVIEE
ncbi:MAG: L,D-transpeptidase [Kiritimatiellae bacterium]|nr:L,D-transpeptidase [Kiritimatiellia bacterium]